MGRTAVAALTDPEGIAEVGLPIPPQGPLVGLSVYMTGWALETQPNPMGVMILVDIEPEGDPILNSLELVLTL